MVAQISAEQDRVHHRQVVTLASEKLDQMRAASPLRYFAYGIRRRFRQTKFRVLIFALISFYQPWIGLVIAIFYLWMVPQLQPAVIHPSKLPLPQTPLQRFEYYHQLIVYHRASIRDFRQKQERYFKISNPGSKEVVMGRFDTSGRSHDPPLDLNLRSDRCNICYTSLEDSYFRYYPCCDLVIHHFHVYDERDLLLGCPYCKRQ